MSLEGLYILQKEHTDHGRFLRGLSVKDFLLNR